MKNYKLKRLENKNVEIEVVIDKNTIKKEYELVFNEMVKNLVVDGFRKGSVPKNIAQKYLDKNKVYEKVIQKILPAIYEEIVKKESLKPVTYPKIDLVKAKEGDDWLVKITLAEIPTVNLKDYKKKVIEFNKKTPQIWVPGKDQKKELTEESEEKKLSRLNEIFNILIKETECQIPDLLIENELQRKLANLVDELQKLGLTIEDYLKSKRLTLNQLKENYKKEIIDSYKLELVLSEIAENEKITVENKEIEDLLGKIKDEKQKENIKKNIYYYAALIRKQKTIDFLLNL